MTHRTRSRLVACIGAALLLCGCSGSEDEASGGGADPTAATATAAPQDATADPTATEEPAPQDVAGDDDRATSAPPGDVAADTQERDSGPLTSADGGFTFETPQGWSDAISQAGADAVAAARADDRADGFFTNLVVVTEEPIKDLDESIEDAAGTIAGDDGDYTMAAESDVDGEIAYGFLISRTVQETDIVQAQRWVEHEGVLYILTLSSAGTQEDLAAEVLEEIVGSWSWQ